MSSPSLPEGAFITTLNGRRCTAVPRADGGQQAATTAAAPAPTQEVQQQQQPNEQQQQQQRPQEIANVASVVNEPEETSTTSSAPEPERTIDTQILAQAQPQPQALVQAIDVEEQDQAIEPLPPAPSVLPVEQEEEPQQIVAAATGEPPSPTLTTSEVAGTSQSVVALPASQEVPSPPREPLQALQDSPPPAAESSPTDDNAVPTSPEQPTQTAAQNDVAAGPPPNVAGDLITTLGLAQGTAAGEVATGSSSPTLGVVPQGNAPMGAPTAVVAGSVIGGLAVVSLIAFLLCFWRKRMLRRRRSTLLTPLSTEPSYDRGDNETNYVIDRGSLGPTPKSEKVRAAMGANVKWFLGQFSRSHTHDGSRSVNMNRGNSQFMDPAPQHSRNNSILTRGTGPKDVVTTKDRFMDWWTRLTADVNFNWRLRNDRNAETDPFAAARDMKEKKAAMSTQPDFLTLLGMDERDVQREADQRRLNHTNQGSTGSANHFLGRLELDFDNANNPFSDSNSLQHDSAKPSPLTVSRPNNPFSDANAIGGPKPLTTYVADVRRSRGQSLGGGPGPRQSNAPYSPRMDSMYRESVQSVESFATRRNKFRSDPFDLERPELLNQRVTSSNVSTMGSSFAPRLSSNTSGTGVRRPSNAHTRSGSYSSKYSSGVSMGDWSDPGPDVGPAANRWDTPSPIEGHRPSQRKKLQKRDSNASRSSVGKAL